MTKKLASIIRTSVGSTETKKHVIVTRLRPEYRTIPIDQIKQVIWAIPEFEIFDDFMADKVTSGHVMVVKDRDQFWASEF